MAQRMKAEAAGLNVRTHPHDADTYKELCRAAFGLKKSIRIRGERSGIITSLHRIDAETDLVRGVLTTFLELDLEGAWLDTETLEEASDEAVESIIIPENLRPNMMAFYFAFDLVNHEIIFEHYGTGKRLSHVAAHTFFSRLFKDKRIARRFGDVKVTVIKSRGSIDRLFSIPRITDIEIYIEKPNSDFWEGSFEQNTEEHLEDKHARSMTVAYKAERGRSLQRDDDLDALLRTSIRNGRAVAKGYGDDGHMIVTTDSYPRVEQERYDPDLRSDSQAFDELVTRFRRR